MAGLRPDQSATLAALFHSLPDSLLGRLHAALNAARKSDKVFAPVADLAAEEVEEREVRGIVLAPLRPLADETLTPPRRALISGRDLGRVWDRLRTADPERLKQAMAAALDVPNEERNTLLYNRLCQSAAESLTSEGVKTDGERTLVRLLLLSPILRRVLPRLSGWVKNLGADANAALRLAYKDAVEIADDLGPLFIEALFVYLDEPYRILRVIASILIEPPSDRYLAASELASFGEALLADAEARVAAVVKFDPARGAAAIQADAASVRLAAATLKEFEDFLRLAADGPWGARVIAARRKLLSAVEEHLRKVEPALSKALPLQVERMAGMMGGRSAPRTDQPPAPATIARAVGFLSFLEGTKSSASAAGFASVRTKVLDGVTTYLDTYTEDLLDRLKSGRAGDPGEARAYLEVAAELCGVLHGKERATVIRRRAAAALA